MNIIYYATTVADILVAVAYFLIPSELYYFYRRLTMNGNNEYPSEFKQVMFLFVCFIVCCACTHVVMAWMPYKDTLMINCVIKWITAIISLFTAFKLSVVFPRLLFYPLYTRGIESENLERQVHEQILQENVNIFRKIRQYTESLTEQRSTEQNTEDIYERIGSILFQQLKLEHSVYLSKSSSDECDLIFKTPVNVKCPKTLSYDFPVTTDFEGSWWLISFKIDFEEKGFVAVRMNPSTSSVVRRRNIILNNSQTISMQETQVSTSTNIASKSYFQDVILDIVDHFESSLIQARVKERNEILINQLKERNDALNKARMENQVAAKQSRDWLSVMSHEMRTPIFAVEALSELLLEKVNINDRELTSSLSMIKDSATHLSDIVNNILDFTKFENGDYELDNVDFNIHDVINDTCAISVRNEKRMYSQVCIFIKDNLPLFVNGDVVRFRQIFLNVIGNAVKFTPDEGLIKVTVSAANAEEESSEFVRVQVEVADTGIGIKKEDVQKIFKQYSQSDSTMTRKFSGTGLGLSICKKLCEIMKGDISFRPNIPEGTIFSFNVLLKKTKIPITIEKTLSENMKSCKIIVVDEPSLSRKNIVFHLHKIGLSDIIETDDYENFENIKKGETVPIVYFINSRCKKAAKNTEELRLLAEEYKDNLILQTHPYVKSVTGIKAKYELIGPAIDKEMVDLFTEIGINMGIIKELKTVANKKIFEPMPNVNLLVAEDNPFNQTVIRKILEKFQIHAIFADDGKQALEKYIENQEDINIILMDIMMPNMDGYQSSVEIRKISKSPKRPWIIALTANAFWEDKVKAIESGMNDFVTKPAKVEILYQALKKASSVVA